MRNKYLVWITSDNGHFLIEKKPRYQQTPNIVKKSHSLFLKKWTVSKIMYNFVKKVLTTGFEPAISGFPTTMTTLAYEIYKTPLTLQNSWAKQ